MSLGWGLPAVANVDRAAFHRRMEALKWKITMLRCFDGGFLHNAYRLEYQQGEYLLGFAIRTSCYLVAFCAECQNPAITGDPRYRAEELVDEDRNTGVTLAFSTTHNVANQSGQRPIAVEAKFNSPRMLRSIDLRVIPKQLSQFNLAQVRICDVIDGEWKTIYWGASMVAEDMAVLEFKNRAG